MRNCHVFVGRLHVHRKRAGLNHRDLSVNSGDQLNLHVRPKLKFDGPRNTNFEIYAVG